MFDQLKAEPFPAAAKGLELQGIDLVFLDSLMAGCISSLLAPDMDATERAGKIELLSELKTQLDAVLESAPPAALPYFKRLGAIAALVLTGAESVHADA